MVDHDSMVPNLQFVGAQFFNFLLSKLSVYHVTSNFACQHYRTLKGHISILLDAAVNMVLYTSSPLCIVHAQMTLTRSKVKVTGRLPHPVPGLFLQDGGRHLGFLKCQIC